VTKFRTRLENGVAIQVGRWSRGTWVLRMFGAFRQPTEGHKVKMSQRKINNQ
jgi:hypothetical protein